MICIGETKCTIEKGLLCQTKQTIFSLEPQGHVMDHALKREKMIIWIPTTRQVENLSFYSLNL